jgi:P-type Ca2+ transporter type 2C
VVDTLDLLVGDIVHLEPGDVIPADGILVSGHNVMCDESCVTGEADLRKKMLAHDVMARIEDGESPIKLDPFIISGASITEGVGTFLVTAVGARSSWGLTNMCLREHRRDSPIEKEISNISKIITKLIIGYVRSFYIPCCRAHALISHTWHLEHFADC